MWRQSALDKKVSDRGPSGGSSARDASNQNGTQSKRDFLNAAPPEQRKAVALLLKGRNPRDTKDGKNGKNKGDDIVKAKGSPMLPDHLDSVCKWFRQRLGLLLLLHQE
jgi:hypothetical protein